MFKFLSWEVESCCLWRVVCVLEKSGIPLYSGLFVNFVKCAWSYYDYIFKENQNQMKHKYVNKKCI